MPTHQNEIRNSHMELDQVYFWTSTVKDWRALFKNEKYIHFLLSSWKELVFREKICIYGFVIMPNHIHVIWEMLEVNGKEMPHASFNKFTSHLIVKDLKSNNSGLISAFKVEENDRDFRIWQRDPLAIWMDKKEKLEQKLNYIHLNPLQDHWNLVVYPEDYQWSSSRFYETGIDEFEFLTHYLDRF